MNTKLTQLYVWLNDYRLPTSTDIILCLALLALLAQSACMGAMNYQNVPPIPPGQVEMGHYPSLMLNLRQAAMGSYSHMIFNKGDLLAFAWRNQQGWALVCLQGNLSLCNSVHQAGNRYMVLSTSDFSTLMKFAEERVGWRQITSQDFANRFPAMYDAVLKYSAAAGQAAAWAGSINPTVIVLPVGYIPDWVMTEAQ